MFIIILFFLKVVEIRYLIFFSFKLVGIFICICMVILLGMNDIFIIVMILFFVEVNLLKFVVFM